MIPWKFADQGGDEITVRPAVGDGEPAAAFEINDGESVVVPPHKLAGMVRAMYASAGLPVPELPDIPDPALLTDLAMDLHAASHGDCLDPSAVLPRDWKMAAHLASLGWRKP